MINTTIKNKDLSITIIRPGYPLNFDMHINNFIEGNPEVIIYKIQYDQYSEYDSNGNYEDEVHQATIFHSK